MAEDSENRSCIVCMKSSTDRRSFLLTQDFVEEHEFILDYISLMNAFIELDDYDRVCEACLKCGAYWDRLRKNKEKEEIDGSDSDADSLQDEQLLASAIEQQEEFTDDQKPKRMRKNALKSQEITAESNCDDQKVTTEDQANSVIIKLSGYLRLPTNSDTCVINYCKNQNLRKIEVGVRTTVLIENNLYIPENTYICDEHLESVIWDDLKAIACQTLSTFNNVQVTDMLNMQKTVIKTFAKYSK